MSPENDLNVDEILSKLDQNSRKARIFSIVFTIFSLVILVVILYLTYQAKGKLDSLNAEVADKQEQANEQKIIASDYKKDKESLNSEIQKIANVQNSNSSCEEKKNATKMVLTEVGNMTGVDLAAPVATPIPKVTKDSEGISKVYIQIVDESQRGDAKRIAQMLRSRGFNVPGIELVKALRGRVEQTQVRYFHKDDEKYARKLADQLNLGNVKVIFTPLSAENGQMEIWFAENSFNPASAK